MTSEKSGRPEHEVIPELVPSPLYLGIENSRRFRALPLFASLLSLGKEGYAGQCIAYFISRSAEHKIKTSFGRTLYSPDGSQSTSTRRPITSSSTAPKTGRLPPLSL